MLPYENQEFISYSEQIEELFASNLLKTKLHLLNNCKTKAVSNTELVSLSQVFQLIESDSSDNYKHIIRLRKFEKNSVDYNFIKENKLQTILFNGSFQNTFENDNLIEPTGLLYGDIDNSDLPLDDLKEALVNTYPFVIAAWTASGGKGLGFVCNITNVKTKEDYTACYKEIAKTILEDLNVVIDSKCSNISRKNVISHDPSIRYNLNGITPYAFERKQGDIRCLSIKGLIVDSHHMSPSISGKRFFSENYIDIHNPELLKEADIDYGNGSYLFLKKYHKTKLAGIKGKIPVGKRNKTLFAHLCSFVHLNGHYSKEQILEWLKIRNEMYCSTPLAEKELSRIMEKVYQLKESNMLQVTKKERLTVFDSKCKLNKEEKLSVVSKNKQLKNTLSIESAIKQLLLTTQKITKDYLSKVTGLSTRTINRRWTTFKDQIEKHNHIIMEKENNKEYKIKLTNKEQPELKIVKPIETTNKRQFQYNDITYMTQLCYLKTG